MTRTEQEEPLVEATAAPCVAATTPSECSFRCGCTHPDCDCSEHCVPHADAILEHRTRADRLGELAAVAQHPGD